MRIKDIAFLDLVSKYEKENKSPNSEFLIKAEVLAYQNKFEEAANAYIEGRFPQKAVQLLQEIKQFELGIKLLDKNIGSPKRNEEDSFINCISEFNLL